MTAQGLAGKIRIAIVLLILLKFLPAVNFGQQTVVQGIVGDSGTVREIR